MDRPLTNTYWVIPQRLLAGEYPGHADEGVARLRLQCLQEAGFQTFVDLTEERELPEYRQLLSPQAEYQRFAIADTGVPNNVTRTREALEAIRSALERERPVYVHCRAGIGRTGLIIGCFLADEKSNGKVALKILNRIWQQSERAAAWPTIPQTLEQADYIRHWPKFGRRPTQRTQVRHFADRR